MWMLDNQTPFETEHTWARDKNGVHQQECPSVQRHGDQ